jgi:hypothetical protein
VSGCLDVFVQDKCPDIILFSEDLAWYAEFLLEIDLKILLRKIGARLIFKIALISLHIDLVPRPLSKLSIEKRHDYVLSRDFWLLFQCNMLNLDFRAPLI